MDDGEKEYKAIKVRPEGDQEVIFKAPGDANDDQMWQRAKQQMLNAYGHANVTCWVAADLGPRMVSMAKGVPNG